ERMSLSFDSARIHAGYNPQEHNNAVSVPIYQTVSYNFKDTDHATRLFSFQEAGWLYSRVTNPTVHTLELRAAALDGASAALAVASGMAAISYALLNAAEGGKVLSSPYLYGGSADSFSRIYKPLGIEIVQTADTLDPEKLDLLIDDSVKAVFVESISNPSGVVADIEGLSAVTKKHGVALIVDNTFATPYLLRPFEHGADIVVYSSTKAYSGHGNAISGLILESGKFPYGNGRYPQFTQPEYVLRDRNTQQEGNFFEYFGPEAFTSRARLVYLNYFGAALGPFDAYLALVGVETLSERVQKQSDSALKIVRHLESSPNVSFVSHPYQAGNPQADLVKKYLPKGGGAVLAFGFKGTVEQSEKFINSLELFSYHVNVGDVRSLVSNTAKTTHSELNPELQSEAGIYPETIRLSIGLEDPGDLIADLEQAFAKAFESSK
ncbi:MAG: aminotransferase class I/II-fold pyridoxal phosphate-dependent enzyme, partial [Clostridiales bacterium]|nr:aminotransferase class I/II-fold pyridoxal phosphate-dependent enzyme [Clostridiales bacterium]